LILLDGGRTAPLILVRLPSTCPISFWFTIVTNYTFPLILLATSNKAGTKESTPLVPLGYNCFIKSSAVN
jgi:hypothetical protein